MKRLTALLLACMTFVCAAVSCSNEDKGSGGNKAETTTVADNAKDTDGEKSDDDKKDDKKADDKKDDEKKKDSEKKSDGDKDDDDNGGSGSDDGEGESADVPAEAEAVVKKFAEATLKSDVNTMLSCLYPKAVVDKMNESGDADDFSDAVGDPGENGNLLSVSVSDGKKLSKKAAEGVKRYYSIYSQMLGANDEYKIVEGYSMKLAMTIEDDGQKEDMNEDIMIVKLEGEDWLLVPMGEDELVELVSQEEEITSAETTTEKKAD